MAEPHSALLPPTRFRILGPVEFFDGRSWGPIGATKQVTLLALLLLNANRVVPSDQLMAEMWGEHAPASASALVAGYVWRLRRRLGDVGGAALVTRAPGYQLLVDDGALDTQEYERSVAVGRSAQDSGDLALAAVSFAAALDLWRGAPFADAQLTPSVMAETARLEESRLAVMETRIGVEIGLGRHETLLPELKLMVAQYPLRERLHAHLMTALYRSGQQADALGTYRDLRRLLVGELGVEPSKPLRELQQRILNEELLLEVPPVPSPAAEAAALLASVPRLPPSPLGFAGRESELASLTTSLRSGHALCAVYGLAGSGKSALALRAAHDVADRFPDGQIIVDLHGTGPDTPMRSVDVAGRILRALGVPAPDIPTDLEDAVARWYAVLAGRRVLTVLDDVFSAEQVRPFTVPAPGSAVILTGRRPVGAVDGSDQVRIGRLPPAVAVEVLRRSAGTERIDAQPSAASEIARFCEYLPALLRIAGARLAQRPEWPAAEMARRLANPQRRLDVLTCDDMSVRRSLAASVRLLRRLGDEQSLTALCLLGAVDLPVVSVAVLAALLEVSEDAAEKIAENLVDTGLIEALQVDRYWVPQTVRLFAGEQGSSPTMVADAVRRLVTGCADALRPHVAILGRHSAGAGRRRDERTAASLTWYRRERSTLDAVARLDPDGALHQLLGQLRTIIHDTRTGDTRSYRTDASALHR